MAQGNKSYSKEFKQDAVKLASKIGQSRAARELGLAISTISGWVKKNESSFEQQKELSYEELLKENKKLKKEAQYAKTINNILKKSIGILSKDQLDSMK